MICSGINAATGQLVAIEFTDVIRTVREDAAAPGDVYLAPGFVDLQVNGFGGVDFNHVTTGMKEIDRAIKTILATGVTRFLPTIITGPPANMVDCLRTLRLAQTTLSNGSAIAGFHVEGPHIDPMDGPRGAHAVEWVRPPDWNEFQCWQEATEGNIRLVTLSPHWPGAPEYIESLVRAGVAVSIGHTAAAAPEIEAAVNAGATLSTHLGNAAPKLLPKTQNCLWDQLSEDRLSASFIADGLHLSDSFFRAAIRAKGTERTVLVTDASAPAGAAPGHYRLGELNIDLTDDGRVVLAGQQRLAGSALRMPVAIENAIRIAGLSLGDAIRTATVNPARIVHLNGRTAGLVAGDRADFVIFRLTNTIEIEAVYLDGVRVV
jgi:N-acetylglucosamine-6-phosphate deacetylase